MFRRLLLFSTVTLTLASAVPALAQAAQTVTATGTGQVRVRPANRHSNASIAAAYNAARMAAIIGALSQAHQNALVYANGAGLTLGSLLSVTDASGGPFGYGPGPFFGPFAPGTFCGTIRSFHIEVTRGKSGAVRRRAVPGKKVHRCFVPGFAYTTLTVTYAAS